MSFYNELLDRGEPEKENGLIFGLVRGEVKENWDKDHPGMVKVDMLLGESKKNEIDWVPVAVPYAGKEYGTYLLPEIGAQVLIAFQMGQDSSPFVIGCIWDKKNVLPKKTADQKNKIKSFSTKGGNKIIISDEEGKEKITVSTKGKLVMELDDEKQKISLHDKEGNNAATLDAKNGVMTFESKKKAVFKINGKEMLVLDGEGKKATLKADQIKAEATQKLHLKGQNTTLEGSSTTIKGQNVKLESQASLSLKGTASLKAESSGIAQIKGSMLKLN